MITSKKILAFVLLLAVAAPLFFYATFFIQQHQIQHQMAEKLEKESLQNFTLHKKAILWLKKDKELLIDGNLFDVKTITTQSDSVNVSGLFDEQEQQLKNDLVNTIPQNENKPTPLTQLMVKYMTTSIIFNDLPNSNSYNQLRIEQNYFSYNESAKAMAINITTPPPNV